jgi:hypothetical protein
MIAHKNSSIPNAGVYSRFPAISSSKQGRGPWVTLNLIRHEDSNVKVLSNAVESCQVLVQPAIRVVNILSDTAMQVAMSIASVLG